MHKHRLILIVLAIVLTAVLYFLPRIVVENQEDTEINAEEMSRDSGSGLSGMAKDPAVVHDIDIPDADLDVINSLRDQIRIKSPDRISNADSLSRIFISHHQYDSAAKYLEIVAELEPGLDAFERAGSAYYEAQGFTMNKESADA